jgi:CheY-like chemotaxis protein
MVVEDEPDLYDTLLALFEIWSVDGIAFTSGADAMNWIKDVDAGKSKVNLPELALLDIRLPEASGPEIAHRLRESPHLKNIGIVLMTAYHLAPNEEQDVMKQSEADILLYKPLPKPAEFRKVLQDAVEKRNGK